MTSNELSERFDYLQDITCKWIDATAQAGREYLYSSEKNQEEAYVHWMRMREVQYSLMEERTNAYQEMRH